MFYKYGGKLVGERTRRPLSFEITDHELLCDMEEADRVFDEVTAEVGLNVSVVKTELFVAGSNLEEGDLAPLYIRGQLVVRSSKVHIFGLNHMPPSLLAISINSYSLTPL